MIGALKSPRRRRGMGSITAAVAVLLVMGPAQAGPLSAQLPPKVKPDAPGAVGLESPIPSGFGAVAGPGATRLGYCGGDDWEPEIASDSVGHVYVVWTHFVGDPTCDPASANPRFVYIQVSSDGGASFGPPHVVSESPEGLDYPSQVDSVVTVDQATGAVYVSFLAYGLQGSKADVIVAKSTNFGATFTARKVNGPKCQSCDHPWPAAVEGDVYVAYAHGKDHFISHSSDGGNTWTEALVFRAGAVAFAEGSVVDDDGNVYFAWGDCRVSSCRGKHAGDYRVSRTRAGSLSTAFTFVASAPAGPECPYDPNCGYAYFGIQDDIAIDAAGTLYLLWQDGQDHFKAGSPPVANLSRSTDGGLTWQVVGRADDKSASGCAASLCYALFPRIEGAGPGDISVMWMDDRKGAPLDHTNGWNVWMRSSTNGGNSWSGPSAQVSTYDPSLFESRPNGFLFPYGDYQGIDLLPSGQAAMIWGQGINYTGGPSDPGHIVYRSMPT